MWNKQNSVCTYYSISRIQINFYQWQYTFSSSPEIMTFTLFYVTTLKFNLTSSQVIESGDFYVKIYMKVKINIPCSFFIEIFMVAPYYFDKILYINKNDIFRHHRISLKFESPHFLKSNDKLN